MPSDRALQAVQRHAAAAQPSSSEMAAAQTHRVDNERLHQDAMQAEQRVLQRSAIADMLRKELQSDADARAAKSPRTSLDARPSKSQASSPQKLLPVKSPLSSPIR